jgi:hypothetical protein
MDSKKSQLVVTMTNVEFAKPFHYFLTVQLDGEGEKVKKIYGILRPKSFFRNNRGGQTFLSELPLRPLQRTNTFFL